ncbi:MAG: N-acetylneuraminate synthase family protein [Rhodobacterales bacterium]|nr:N-acetylneuraminate synthase family protein [Rhodobacterales bacterium]
MSRFFPEHVMIIAEVGSNHDGSLDTAFALIDMAAAAGADVVKFQSFLADDLLAADDPNHARIKSLELPRDWYGRLMDHCAARGVTFLSTATNDTTIGWMEDLGVAAYKIASCNITHQPLIDRLAAIGKPIIASAGMADLDEVVAFEAGLRAAGHAEHAVLHCVAEYPTQPKDLHLGHITTLKGALACPVGFSDHSPGAHMAVAAVALGARIVEKHISLDKSGAGMDHEVAVLPDVFRDLCRGVRDAEAALDADFRADPRTVFTMRRSVRFARDLPAGAVVAATDLKVTRPEDGLAPATLPALAGRRLAVAVSANQPTSWDLFEGGAP